MSEKIDRIDRMCDKLDRLASEPGDEYWEIRDELLALSDTDPEIAQRVREAGYPA